MQVIQAKYFCCVTTFYQTPGGQGVVVFAFVLFYINTFLKFSHCPAPSAYVAAFANEVMAVNTNEEKNSVWNKGDSLGSITSAPSGTLQ